MLYKTNNFRLIHNSFEWQGMGRSKWIPLLVVYVIIPLMNLLQLRKIGLSEIFMFQILRLAFIIIPMVAPLWITLIFQEYYETLGNELLFLYDRYKVKSAIKYTCQFQLLIFPLFFIYSFLKHQFLIEYMRIIIVICFICALSYFLMVIFHSSAVTWVLIICYGIYNIIFHNGQYCCAIYYYENWMNSEFVFFVYIPMLFIAILLFFFGQLLSLKTDKMRYN